MTNLSDFLKTQKVRCVKAYGDCLTVGKEYSVLNIRMEVEVRDDEGGRYYWESDHFEPVLDSAENPLQDMKLTPEFEAVEPTFKAGDPVYFPRLSNKLCVIGAGQEDDYVDEINGSKALAEMQSDLDFVYDQKTKSWLWDEKDCASQLLHATPENYELLSKLYPHIKFEAPPKPLTGSDLARAMFDAGHEYVVGRVGNHVGVYYTWSEGAAHFFEVGGTGTFDIEPIDPRTGEPLTEAVLDE